MTIEQKLKELIVSRYGSMVNFSRATGIANSTLATILKRGINKANINNIFLICKELGISATALSDGEIKKAEENPKKYEYIDLQEKIDQMRKEIYSTTIYTLDGQVVSFDQLNFILDGVQFCIDSIAKFNGRKKDN